MYSKGIKAMNDNHDTVKSHNASLPAKTKVIFFPLFGHGKVYVHITGCAVSHVSGIRSVW